MIRQLLRRAPAISFLVSLSLVNAAEAQRVSVGGLLDDYVRLLQLAGVAAPSPLLIRPIPADIQIHPDSSHPWSSVDRFFRKASGTVVTHGFFDPEIRNYWNSAYPRGQNDGAVWQGRGFTTQVTAGGYVKYGPLTATFRPSLIYNENRDFKLAVAADPARSVYAYAFQPVGGPDPAIDLPQQFGPDAFTTFDWGETSVRLDWRGLTAGVSNEPMWWGPGIQNGIVLSNNAPGFLHGFLGTRRPVNIGIGKIEVDLVWGRLSESGYFDTVDTNDTRFFTGIVFDFEPKPLPGLYLGASRVFMQDIPEGGLPFSDYFLVFQGVTKDSQATPDNPSGNDERDQLISVFARWLLPESGFEAYVEFSRNDHNADVRDFLLEPGHSEGYTLGFQKALTLSDNRYVRLLGELTHLERSKTLLGRPTPVYYIHGIVRQGYTQRGQVLGAGVGPGGNSQYFRGDLFSGWGRAGFSFLRHVRDNDAFFEVVDLTQNRPFMQHHVEFTLAVDGMVFLGDLALSGSLGYSKDLNRYYIRDNDVTNVHVRFGLRWLLRN